MSFQGLQSGGIHLQEAVQYAALITQNIISSNYQASQLQQSIKQESTLKKRDGFPIGSEEKKYIRKLLVSDLPPCTYCCSTEQTQILKYLLCALIKKLGW